MKHRIPILLSVVLISLLIIPVTNIISAKNRSEIKWRDKSFLYNMDLVSRLTSRLLYPLGISISPKNVIIGYDNWLFLGDNHSRTLSVSRYSPTAIDVERAKKISVATRAWNDYFSSKGVRLFRVMVGPNKGTIYPEYMPAWARSVTPDVTDTLFSESESQYYIDFRKPLLDAKTRLPGNMYFKTDTHWNDLGAGVAFRALSKQVGASDPELRWPTDAAYEVISVTPSLPGDLSNFLRLAADLSENEPTIRGVDRTIQTTQINFDTKEATVKSGNPMVFAVNRPLLVKSVGALNNKKVLWLRDSFGIAMSPLMAATFSDVLQLTWQDAMKPGGRLVELVDTWKPDYVFLTVVERDAMSEYLTSLPPTQATLPPGR